ncbi:hypothetical protein ACDA63_12805 [Uliginosibacterium sp. sgz301328]|uniref:hypothetical protein n=1 Tax=Uliginosibacterium sp. sgz301328 TaxID=3243764 RepID=UPI00359D3926
MSTTPKHIDPLYPAASRQQRFTQMGQTGVRRGSGTSTVRPLQDRIGLWGDVDRQDLDSLLRQLREPSF